MSTCTFPDCNRPLQARGWCKAHYNQWWLGYALRPIALRNHEKTHCLRGHAFAQFATARHGRRHCRECERIRQAAKRRQAATP